MPVAELMERVSASEFVHWQAFYGLEPWGGEIDDYRAGLAPAIYVNSHAGKDAQPMSPLDFYPHHRPPVEKVEPTPEEAARQIKARIFGQVDQEGEG